ncbi:ABC transporter permease [Halomonadaceae bacterium KBTZ08]
MHESLVVAGKEFRDGLRNRWVLAITLVFAILAIALAWFGAAVSGEVGFTRVSTTIASLASLAVFLIPLIALMLAYDSIVGEDENGTLLLLMTYPLSRTGLLAGKFLGHAAIMALSTLLGFGIAGLVIVVFDAEATLGALAGPFTLFIGSAILLGWCFLAISYLISAIAHEKARAAGMALVVWFLFVLVYDLTLLGILVGTEGQVNESLFQTLLMINPTDIFRLVNLTGFEQVAEASGMLAIATREQHSVAALIALLGLWVVAPLAIAAAVFRRRRT